MRAIFEGRVRRKDDGLLVESRRLKATFIKPRRGRPRNPGPARGAHKTLALFTMLIGTHVKHKFMLKAKMLSSSRMRYGADRSCLPVPDDQAPAPKRMIMPISIFDYGRLHPPVRLATDTPFLFIACFIFVLSS